MKKLLLDGFEDKKRKKENDSDDSTDEPSKKHAGEYQILNKSSFKLFYFYIGNIILFSCSN